MLDIFFGPNSSSDRVAQSGRRAIYQLVDGRLCARVGGVDEEAIKEKIPLMDERSPPTRSDETLAWFCAGLLTAALGWTLYWTIWLLREILG